MPSFRYSWINGLIKPLCNLPFRFFAFLVITGFFAINLQAQESYEQTDYESAENSIDPDLLNENENVVLARPVYDTVPNFLNELDTYLLSDELVNEIEDKYALQLRDISLKQGFLFHNRDTILQRDFLGSSNEEIKLRKEMANTIKRYMLSRGLPDYLSARNATRFLGENYKRTVTLAQKATRIEFKGKDDKWKFGSGLNPFNTKVWAKYSSPLSNLEIYNYLDKAKSLALTTHYQMGYYRPKSTILIQKKVLEVGSSYSSSPDWELEYKTVYYLNKKLLSNMVSYLSAAYRF